MKLSVMIDNKNRITIESSRIDIYAYLKLFALFAGFTSNTNGD